MQTVKQGLKRTAGTTIQERLSKFLFTYRLTPQSTTGVPPSTLLMGRHIRTRLDGLFPDISSRVESQQTKQAEQHNTTKPVRSFKDGDLVYVKDFSTTLITWIPGKITKVTGPLSYHVEVIDGRTVRRHVDAVRTRQVRYPRANEEPNPDIDDLCLPDLLVSSAHQRARRSAVLRRPTRRSTRHRPPPDRLGRGT